jgi:hypothetical protein
MTNSETTEPIDPKHKLCEQCGHNWDAHLLHGYGSPPTEGWMECPVEGCECKNTWGVSAEMKEYMAFEAKALSSKPSTTSIPKASSFPTALQTVAVIAFAIATSAMLYSQSFNDCCRAASTVLLGILTLPAMLFGLLLSGGNIHGGSEWNYYAGLAVQFYLILWFIRWVKLRKRSSR